MYDSKRANPPCTFIESIHFDILICSLSPINAILSLPLDNG